MILSASRPYTRWTLIILAVAVLSACTAFKPEVAPMGARGDPPPRKVELPSVIYLGVPCYLHEVRWPEETLGAIARWYTGNLRNARILERITPNLRADDLRRGDMVFVPLELTRRNTPLTRSYARRHGKVPSSNGERTSQPMESVPDDADRQDRPPSPYGPRTFPE